MPKKPQPTYRQIESELNRQIAQQDFRHATLVCGEQDYLRTENTHRLQRAILGDGDAMNSTVFRGEETTAAQVIEMAETLPFFAERRVITVEESPFFERPGEEAERLADYIPRIPETSYLIFVEPSPNSTFKLCRAIRKYGFVCQCDTPDSGQLRQWTAGLFSDAGLAIDNRTLDFFLQYAGTDMLNVRSEAEKLISYCLMNGRVTAEDVTKICTPVVNDRIFDMISAISGGKREEALSIYMDMLKLQTKPQVILALMIRQYTQLLEAGELLQKMGDREAAAVMKANPWVFTNKIRPALRGHTAYSLERALEACVQADYQYKQGKISADLAVEELIVVYSAQGGKKH